MADLRTDLDGIKKTYRAVPLPVFARDRFIEAVNINETIKGALVELHFEFHHYCIKSKNQDSFNATIQQILVLQPGAPRPTTAYKRKNFRDGPVQLKLVLELATLDPVAGPGVLITQPFLASSSSDTTQPPHVTADDIEQHGNVNGDSTANASRSGAFAGEVPGTQTGNVDGNQTVEMSNMAKRELPTFNPHCIC